MNEACETCGSPLSALGTGEGALARHVLDYSDPHHTLSMVPSIELGVGAPVSAEGHKRHDLYVDLAAQRIYVANGGPDDLSWAPATPAPSVTAAQLTSVLSGYVTAAALSNALAGYVSASSAHEFARSSDLAAYATLDGLSNKLSGYVRADGIGEYGFLTSSALSDALSGYVTKTALSATLSTSYLGKEEAAQTYATKEETDGFVRASDRESFLQGTVYRRRLGPDEWPELDLDQVLASYLTSDAAAGTYVTKAWLSTNGYITSAALYDALSPYVPSSSLASALAGYVTRADADSRYVKLEDYEAPPDLPAGYEGMVVRAPTSPGVYPERNLDVILQGYLTTTAASATYVTRSFLSGMGYQTAENVRAALAPYVTGDELSGALAGYLTASDAKSTYVTPAWLEANRFLRVGGPDTSNYVYRSVPGAQLDLDVVLSSWPAQSISATEAKPPAASSVHAALAKRDSSISSLQAKIDALAVTGGASCAMNVITEPEGLPDNPGLVPVDDRACNSITMSGEWLERVSNTLTVAVPDARPGVCRDFLVVLDFPSSAGTGRVPVTFNGIVTRTNSAVDVFSYTPSGLWSMDGVVYGMKVVYAMTEIGPGVLAVTRKNMYEV